MSLERLCVWLSGWRLIGSMQRRLSTKRRGEKYFWRAKLTASHCGSNKSTLLLSKKVSDWEVCYHRPETYVCLIFWCIPFWWFLFVEHEACIRDITELKWQLKLEREKLDQAQEKLSHAELLNQRLHEDINFAKKQVPIVKENIDLQRGIVDQINSAQAEVTF